MNKKDQSKGMVSLIKDGKLTKHAEEVKQQLEEKIKGSKEGVKFETPPHPRPLKIKNRKPR